MSGILAMSPSMQCESAYGAEYFVFKKPFVCRRGDALYVWKYFVVGFNNADKNAFHGFNTDGNLIAFLVARNIIPDSISGLDWDLISALQKAIDEAPAELVDANKAKGLVL